MPLSPLIRVSLLLALIGCSAGFPPASSKPRLDDTVDASGEDSGSLDSADSMESEDSADTEDSDVSETGIEIDWPEQRVGMFYLAWHAYAAKAMAAIPEAERGVIEDVVTGRSDNFSDLLLDRGLYETAMAFHYHQEPQAGFYCMYRTRPGEAPYAEPYAGPDCGDMSVIAARHARQLWDAGVDFVYVDLTNLPVWSEFGDVLGLRPFEVLIEEWTALRARGIPTPQIAAWVPASAVSAGETPMVTRLLEVYDAHAKGDVLLRHLPSGQPVLFLVGGSSDASLLAEIASRGLLAVPMWGNLSAEQLAAGTAGWMQPCVYGGSFTTLIEASTPCNQGYTTTSPLGTVLSVSRSFQIGYASLPLQASGRNGGLTLQKQFETALSVQPDYLLLNAWNEHIAQPQANPYDASLGALRRSMGLGAAAEGDASADWLWVDMYGQEFDRDFEPTVEDSGEGLALLESCLRVYRSGSLTCSDLSEACCQLGAGWSRIWSLRPAGGEATRGDYLPTASDAEKEALIAAGSFEEVCNPFYGPPGMCGGGTTADGPFFLYPEAGEHRVALYRCYTGRDHFLSTDPACEGTTAESLLGWASEVRNTETPRPLRRCYRASEPAHFHWLEEHCPEEEGVVAEGLLGYVK